MSNAFSSLKARLVKTNCIQFHKVNLSTQKKRKLNIMLLIGISVIGLGYLGEINGLATKGYQIKELQKNVTRLQEENKKLQIHSIEAQSFAAIKPKIESMKLVQSDTVEYIESASAVATLR